MQTYANTFGVHALGRDMVTKSSKFTARTDVATVTTAGAATYTAAQILGGIICRDPAGSARTDVLPTAALLIAAMKEEEVGDTVVCHIINQADQDEAITLTAGDGGTLVNVSGNDTIPQNRSRTVIIRLTAVTGTVTYSAYLV